MWKFMLYTHVHARDARYVCMKKYDRASFIFTPSHTTGADPKKADVTLKF